MAATPEWTTTAEDVPSTVRSRADQGHTLELVEEELQARKRSVQAGVVRIRKQVVTETRTIEVVVRREEIVVERHPVERQTADRSEHAANEPLMEALAAQSRDLQPGETLRIPVIEEEIVVQTRPMVVEEVIISKRLVQTSQPVTGTVRREQARVQTTGDVQVGHEADRRPVRVNQERDPRVSA